MFSSSSSSSSCLVCVSPVHKWGGGGVGWQERWRVRGDSSLSLPPPPPPPPPPKPRITYIHSYIHTSERGEGVGGTWYMGTLSLSLSDQCPFSLSTPPPKTPPLPSQPSLGHFPPQMRGFSLVVVVGTRSNNNNNNNTTTTTHNHHPHTQKKTKQAQKGDPCKERGFLIVPQKVLLQNQHNHFLPKLLAGFFFFSTIGQTNKQQQYFIISKQTTHI